MTRRALIIEYSDSYRKIMGELLKNIGVTSHVAHSLEEATNELSKSPDIELIFCEHRTPNINSIDFLKDFSTSQYSHIPKVVVSIDSAEELKKEAKEHGAAGWLTKPFEEQKFCLLVFHLCKFSQEEKDEFAS